MVLSRFFLESKRRSRLLCPQEEPVPASYFGRQSGQLQRSSLRGRFVRRTKDKQWERDAFTTFIGVPWKCRRLAVEAPVASSTRRYITKSLVQQHGETPCCSACLGMALQHAAKYRERFEKLINPNATDVISRSARHHGGRPAARRQCSAGRAATGDPALARDSPSSPLQARREAWRTVQRHRQRRELTRHAPALSQISLQPDVGARGCRGGQRAV